MIYDDYRVVDGHAGRARILNVGTQITLGSFFEYDSNGAYYNSAVYISDSEVLLAYTYAGYFYVATLAVYTSGITLSRKEVLFSDNYYASYKNSIVKLSETSVLHSYGIYNTRGRAQLINIGQMNKHSIHGIALETGNAGTSNLVQISDVVDLAGIYVLIPGNEYYPSADGTRLENTNEFERANPALNNVQQEAFGIAISTTHLKIY